MMTLIVPVVHVLVSLALIFVVLLQKSGSGDMGSSFGGGGSSSVFGARGSGSFLGKVTAILATAFMVTSLTLAVFGSRSGQYRSVMEQPVAPASEGLPPLSPLPGKGGIPIAPPAPEAVDVGKQSPSAGPEGIPIPAKEGIKPPPAPVESPPAPGAGVGEGKSGEAPAVGVDSGGGEPAKVSQP